MFRAYVAFANTTPASVQKEAFAILGNLMVCDRSSAPGDCPVTVPQACQASRYERLPSRPKTAGQPSLSGWTSLILLG